MGDGIVFEEKAPGSEGEGSSQGAWPALGDSLPGSLTRVAGGVRSGVRTGRKPATRESGADCTTNPAASCRQRHRSADGYRTEWPTSNQVTHTFLSDPGRTIQKDLDIQEYTDPDNDPMIPHTLVLKPGLVVHSVYNGYWFWGRPSFYDLWRDLRAATSEIRPDWDLGTPGLREAWAAGDRSPFPGWDKRSGEPSAAT